MRHRAGSVSAQFCVDDLPRAFVIPANDLNVWRVEKPEQMMGCDCIPGGGYCENLVQQQREKKATDFTS